MALLGQREIGTEHPVERGAALVLGLVGLGPLPCVQPQQIVEAVAHGAGGVAADRGEQMGVHQPLDHVLGLGW